MGKTNYITYLEIKRKLIQKISEGSYDNNKLPSEASLAKELEISLVTLRESLMMLALEGYITKRHGSGNYIHPSAFNTTFRNDLGVTFAQSFRQQGHDPEMRIIGVIKRIADEEQASRFGIEAGEVIESAEVLYMADKLPSIYSVQSLPEKSLLKPFQIGRANLNIYEFLQEHCGISITHSINEYRPVSATYKMAEVLELPMNSPILSCEQLFYDIKDQPVLFNVHYFHPERYGVRMLQNWDLNSKY